MRQMLVGILLALVAIAALTALVIGAGLYNVAADEEHTGLVYRLLEVTRERSIASRASDIVVPDLSDPERIKRGAGNYDAMCASCHLTPSAQDTELSRGLYPQPPNLAKVENLDGARAFWVIKHGIKTTGMPAWGRSMEDEYIWDMVAFVRKLPEMSADEYATAVRTSEGHSHGGKENTDQHADEHTLQHEHDESAEQHNH